MPVGFAENNAGQPVEGKRHESCPLCSSSRLKDKYRVAGFTITACLECSGIFVRERLTADELGAYYSVPDSTFVYDDPGNVENLKYYFNNVKSLIEERMPGKGRLLDIGCSAGLFLDVMPGWERYGLEYPNKAGMDAKRKYGDNIFLGSFDDYAAPATFDCITLFDVFDHMPNPREALEKCRSMLRPNGLLVIKVHDIDCLYARISGSSFYAIIPPYHLFYYGRRSLSWILESFGFHVKEAKHMAHILHLKTIFFRLARADATSLWYRISTLLGKTPAGNLRIKKNLHDLITVFAVKAT